MFTSLGRIWLTFGSPVINLVASSAILLAKSSEVDVTNSEYGPFRSVASKIGCRSSGENDSRALSNECCTLLVTRLGSLRSVNFLRGRPLVPELLLPPGVGMGLDGVSWVPCSVGVGVAGAGGSGTGCRGGLALRFLPPLPFCCVSCRLSQNCVRSSSLNLEE